MAVVHFIIYSKYHITLTDVAFVKHATALLFLFERTKVGHHFFVWGIFLAERVSNEHLSGDWSYHCESKDNLRRWQNAQI